MRQSICFQINEPRFAADLEERRARLEAVDGSVGRAGLRWLIPSVHVRTRPA